MYEYDVVLIQAANAASPAQPQPAAEPVPAPAANAAPAPATNTPVAPQPVTNATTDDGKPRQQPQQDGEMRFPWEMIILFGGLMVLMFILPARQRKKQQAKHESMINGLKRDDRVMLQSGKIATIEKVEGDRIFVFVDTAHNVREEYHKNAIINLESEVFRSGGAK